MAPDDSAALKLRAEDAEDLAVISACLQDALVPVRDLAYVPEDRTFLLVANRFRWENGLSPAPGEAAYERTLCGITFSEVTAVSYNGFRRTEDSRILSLLAIRPEDGAVRLEFSGGATIRLEVARILCLAKDLGEPWPTQWQPRHDADERA
jgi:hypothetical protein